jgi:hypothetical protein
MHFSSLPCVLLYPPPILSPIHLITLMISGEAHKLQSSNRLVQQIILPIWYKYESLNTFIEVCHILFHCCTVKPTETKPCTFRKLLCHWKQSVNGKGKHEFNRKISSNIYCFVLIQFCSIIYM